jgi:SET domain-containing protein
MNRIKAKNSDKLRELLREKNKIRREQKEEYVNTSSFDLYIEKSTIRDAGLGVFTRDFILENTILDEYKGQIVESFEINHSDYYYEIIEPDKEKGILGYGIDALKYPRNYMAMINDAGFEKVIQNNCEFQTDEKDKKAFVVTTRDVEPGEELFVCYGEGYWAPPKS